MSSNFLPTDYQTYIHKSRYARFLDTEGRRENWDETVDRYVYYFIETLDRKYRYKVPLLLQSEVRESVFGLQTMPSMRAMMTAGEAARRCNVAVYNCSYLPVSSLRSFAECLYILLCGTGVGYSVEKYYVSQIPFIPHLLSKVGKTIIVGDSKRAWAQAFLELLHDLIRGEIPNIDYSLIRPAGERLITFGGRASGPEPLRELFEFTIKIFRDAAGRQLTSLDCHHIMTKCGDIVVVGGVRRAALICLSDLLDELMRNAKSGNWYTENPHFQLANNSVAYNEIPEVGTFMAEWLSIYQSYSGERGIFNRGGITDRVRRLGRRALLECLFGTNPCGDIILRPNQFCNLSEAVIRSSDSLVDIRQKIRIAAILGTWQSTQDEFKFLSPEWRKNCQEERLLGVSLTGIYDNEVMRGDGGDGYLAIALNGMKNLAINTNAEEAARIGIEASAAVTTCKPSGTVSQLVLSPSGIHPGHAPFYIRRVSADNKDPITKFLKDQGVPNEPHYSKPNDMTVFSFPLKLTGNTKDRTQVSAIDHMKLVLIYNKFWAEHSVSCTISIKPNEWPSVGAFVFDHFDEIAGMSFLPYFTESTVYKQLPYETIDEDTYNRLEAEMPKNIDWSKLADYEAGRDTVTASREFACVGNSCEIIGSEK